MIEAIGISVGVVAAVLAYLQWRYPKAPKNPPLSASPCPSTLRRVLETKTIRVGFFHYPPLIDYDESGENVVATGLYAEVLQHFASQHSLVIEWHPLKLSEALHSVTHREIDCYACIMMSDARYRECDFVGLLHSIAVVGVVRRNEGSVKHPSDLTNRRDIKVAVCQGEIGHHIASTTLRIPSRRLIEVNASDISEIIAQVRDGNANVALADALSCMRMMKTTGRKKEFNLVFAEPPILTVPNGFMIVKDDKDFNAWLDAGLRLAFIAINGQQTDEALSAEFGHAITRLC